MQIDFSDLENALAPLRDVGNDELTFEVEDGDVTNEITVRPLLPPEETLVQRQAQSALEGKTDNKGNVDRYAMLDFFDLFRRETLAYAIVQVNDLDLREVEYVATGEKTKTGKAVRVPKHVALRKLLAKWSRPMIMAAFTKYGELLTHIDRSTEDIVDFEPSDLEAEIERTKKRLADLEAERSRRAAGDANITADQVKAINEAETSTREMTRRAMKETSPPPAPEPSEEPSPEPEAGESPPTPETPQPTTTAESEEEWATFEDIPTGNDLDDTEPEPEEDVPEIVVSNEEPPKYAEPVARPDLDGNTTPDPLGGVMDSFADADDPEIVAQEEARLVEARRRFAEEQARLRDQDIPVETGRVPPHLRGQRPDVEVGVGGGTFRAAKPEELQAKGLAGAAQQIDETAAIRAAEKRAAKRGSVEGTEIRPTETLSGRGQGRRSKKPRINKRSSRGPTNTKFRAPGG